MTVRRRAVDSLRVPLRTPDGRYLIIDGRLWRASNPNLPEEERVMRTNELMRARRLVAAALRIGDPESLRTARRRVNHAKQSLGERGAVWWDDGALDLNRRLVRNTPYAEWHARIEGIEQLIVQLIDERTTSWCPSEIARRMAPRGWRSLMSDVRTAAAHLAGKGIVSITQRGRALAPGEEPRGPIRIERANGHGDGTDGRHE